MRALEQYPENSHRSNTATNDDDEYEHVSHIKGRTCGTLSKSEWEAACKSFCHLSTLLKIRFNNVNCFFFSFPALYLVFAFQKMKKTFNNKGEPEYI